MAQTDVSSPEWDALAQKFGQPQPQQASPGAGDPWAELAAKFSQPVADPERSARPREGQPAVEPSNGQRMQRFLNTTRLIPVVGPMINGIAAEGPEREVGKGAISGLADIGNTLVNVGVKGVSAVAPRSLGAPLERWNADRQESLQGFNDSNASTAFSAGRIGGNIAATAPVGGVLGAGMKGLASIPALARAAPALQALSNSVSSAGFRTGLAPTTLPGQAGNLALRVAGGAVTGGASAGLVDPGSAATGAVIGGALPPAFTGFVKAGDLLGAAVNALRTPESARAARAILEAGGYKTPEEIASVRAALGQQGPNIVPEPPTVPQILQNAGVSQLGRTLRNAGDTALLERETAQNAARLTTLDRVSPVTGTVQQAAENFGNGLTAAVRPAEAEASKAVRAAFDAVDPFNETRFKIPMAEMRGAQQKYLGPGTFGTGSKAQQAINEAARIGEEAIPPSSAVPETDGMTVSKFVPFAQLQNLRSSLGEAADQAATKGANKEAAALRQMVAEVDARANAVATGKGDMGEYFPADIVNQWRTAIALHADKMERFHTGPQSQIFRRGGDGLPAAQGAELAPKFFSPRGSQSADIAAFQKIADPETLAALKNFAITDAASQTDRLGRLTNAKLGNWTDARTGALKGLLDEGELAQLIGVRKDLSRADAATSLGLATGSNTAQNAQSALGLGLLDNRAVGILANRIPVVGKFTGPMLDALRDTAKRGKVERLGGLLSDPAELDRAIAESLSRSTRRPGLLDSAGPMLPLILRSAPLLSTGQ